MSFTITPIDQGIIKDFSLVLNGERPPLSGGWAVPFQFPPIIKSDNKGVSYQEKDFFNVEPIAWFTGSKSREISLKWVYIVSGAAAPPVGGSLLAYEPSPGPADSPLGNRTWSPAFIARTIKNIRLWYYQTTKQFERGRDLTIHMQGYSVVGVPSSGPGISFRSESVSIDHSDTIIKDESGTYPLKTEISMKLKLWSKGEQKRKDGTYDPMVQLRWLSKIDTVLKPDWR